MVWMSRYWECPYTRSQSHSGHILLSVAPWADIQSHLLKTQHKFIRLQVVQLHELYSPVLGELPIPACRSVDQFAHIKQPSRSHLTHLSICTGNNNTPQTAHCLAELTFGPGIAEQGELSYSVGPVLVSGEHVQLELVDSHRS